MIFTKKGKRFMVDRDGTLYFWSCWGGHEGWHPLFVRGRREDVWR